MVKITVDGKEVTVDEQKNLIDALADVNVEIPHFCYHPKLDIVGMCRLCLVETGAPKVDPATKEAVKDEKGTPVIAFNPKLQAACNTPVREGMHVNVNSEKVKIARAGVMEFQLINHPLDCPVCDKAGECELQNYSFTVGEAHSRYAEPKRTTPDERLGTNLRINHNRCILCYRCVRVERDVAGRDDLELQERGSHSVIGYTPLPGAGEYIDHNFQGALSDLCPVGALLNDDTLFQSRVWWYDEKQSICHGCSRLCKVTTNVKHNELFRYMPPKNPEEDGYFICDTGRFRVHDFSKNRLTKYLLKGHPGKSVDILPQVAENLHNANRVALVGGSFLTNEDLDNISYMVEGWRAADKDVAWEYRTEQWMWEDRFDEELDFLLMKDQRPNTRKARDMNLVSIGDKQGWEKHLTEVDLLIVLNELSAPWMAHAENMQEVENTELFKFITEKNLWNKVILLSTHESLATQKALASIPVAAFPEIKATYLDKDGKEKQSEQVVMPAKGMPTVTEVMKILTEKAELYREMAI